MAALALALPLTLKVNSWEALVGDQRGDRPLFEVGRSVVPTDDDCKKGTVPRIPPGAGTFVTAPQNMRGIARARRAKPGANAPPSPAQSAGRGREDYGWGWVGGVIKPGGVTKPAATWSMRSIDFTWWSEGGSNP